MQMERNGLFEETAINRMKLANRLVRSATWEGMCDEQGRPTEAQVRLYRDLARGGVGLIVSGFAYVTEDGRPLPGAMGLHRDDTVAACKELTSAVHEAGGKVCAQLGHAGGQSRSNLCGGQPLAPSAIKAPQYLPEEPREMTLADIERVLEGFAAAAGRAKQAGFDAVQLHAAHGYLINQFLSPHTNLRNDAFGGNLQGRSRFLLEAYGRVRAAVGPAYPVLVKLNGSDNLEGGFKLEEAVQVARQLDGAGIDAIEVSAGTAASGEQGPVRRNITSHDLEAYNLSQAKAIDQEVGCPVITVGGIRSYCAAAKPTSWP